MTDREIHIDLAKPGEDRSVEVLAYLDASRASWGFASQRRLLPRSPQPAGTLPGQVEKRGQEGGEGTQLAPMLKPPSPTSPMPDGSAIWCWTCGCVKAHNWPRVPQGVRYCECPPVRKP